MNNSKKPFIVVIICILVLIIISALYFISSTNSKSNEPIDSSIYDLKVDNQNTTVESSNSKGNAQQNNSEDTFTSRARQEFINACVNKNKPSAICACAADYIHKKYTPSEILNMYYEFKKANQIPTEVKSAIDFCEQ